ncbi:hypothetical protein J6590_037677 [Homalodisca vitripennis]|nr:hypothetical protein J6590_037677 [Homalodisca vitripennis]
MTHIRLGRSCMHKFKSIAYFSFSIIEIRTVPNWDRYQPHLRVCRHCLALTSRRIFGIYQYCSALPPLFLSAGCDHPIYPLHEELVCFAGEMYWFSLGSARGSLTCSDEGCVSPVRSAMYWFSLGSARGSLTCSDEGCVSPVRSAVGGSLPLVMYWFSLGSARGSLPSSDQGCASPVRSAVGGSLPLVMYWFSLGSARGSLTCSDEGCASPVRSAVGGSLPLVMYWFGLGSARGSLTCSDEGCASPVRSAVGGSLPLVVNLTSTAPCRAASANLDLYRENKTLVYLYYGSFINQCRLIPGSSVVGDSSLSNSITDLAPSIYYIVLEQIVF